MSAIIADIEAATGSRIPRAIILINGIRVKWFSLEVVTNTFYVADTFDITLPLLGQNPILSIQYWAAIPQFYVEIYIGFPSTPDFYDTSDLELFFVGISDEVELDPLQGRIMLNGRDKTSLFIDTKSTQKFSNLFASTIATNFAQQHGLNPVVTPTNIPVGTFYQNAHVLSTRTMTQWDLLTFLAQQSDFVVYVSKNDLIFKPRPLSSDNPYVINLQLPTLLNPSPKFHGNALGFFRSMTLARDIIVKIKVPYSPRTGTSFSVYARSKRKKTTNLPGVPVPSTEPQKFSYIIPGLTKEQAQQRANQYLQNITKYEVRMTASMPGDNLLQKDSLIKFTGTQSSLDQLFYAESITRTLDLDGYRMEITSKNHSVDSEIVP